MPAASDPLLILTEETVYVADEAAPEPEPVRVLDEAAIAGEAAVNGGGVVALPNGEVACIGADGAERCESGIDDEICCLHLLAEDPLVLLIGTEPPHVYRMERGTPARRIESFARLAVRDDWYTPWGGPPAVRSLAHSGADVYADIHVGSIMRSADRGESWKPVTPGLHQDVHQVAVCPAAPERVYANTAQAVFVSGDRGDSWEHRSGGLPARYGRAVAVHPADPDCLLASVSRGPHAEGTGKLFRSDDAGRSWAHVRDGFPEVARDNVDTFRVAFDAAGVAWAAVEETLYRSGDRGRRWQAVWSASSEIRAVSCAAAA